MNAIATLDAHYRSQMEIINHIKVSSIKKKFLKIIKFFNS